MLSKDIHKNTEVSAARVQPLRVLNRRPDELLCITTEDIPEWVDIESVVVIESIKSWIEEGIVFTETLS